MTIEDFANFRYKKMIGETEETGIIRTKDGQTFNFKGKN